MTDRHVPGAVAVAAGAPEGQVGSRPTRPPLTLDRLWPPGTTGFVLRTFAALVLALYTAFALELDSASSAGICVLILAQPNQGMILSKSLYRLLGTLVGCAVAILLVALFPQDRVMLLASFTLFMAVETALGSWLRDFRSYGSILAGYTVAIIAIANIDTPNNAFTAAVDRVAAIVLGIVSIALVSIMTAEGTSSRGLRRRLREGTRDTMALVAGALEGAPPPSIRSVVLLASRLMPLRGEITYAAPEAPRGRARAAGARSALVAILDLISAACAVAIGLGHLQAPSPDVEDARAIVRTALRGKDPRRFLPRLDEITCTAATAGRLQLAEAYILDRLRFMLETLHHLRDGLLAFRTGRSPDRDVKVLVHHDRLAVGLNALRVVVAVGLVSVVSVMSGESMTAQVILFTAVFVSLGSVQTDPSVLGWTALFSMPIVILISTIYDFFILPNIEGFPLFALALLPVVVVTCWLVQKGLGGAGLIIGAQSIVLIGPTNVQQLDPDTFVTTATMLALSGLTIFLSVRLVLPVDPAQRQLRLALAVGDSLRAALARRTPQAGATQTSRLYDRLAQFRTWQRDERISPARRQTAQRLFDIGQLGLVVQRAWAAIERAQPLVDASLDTRARTVLPTLDAEATRQTAQLYLDAAKTAGTEGALPLVHAAGALYGATLLTRIESRLLHRVNLVRRWP